MPEIVLIVVFFLSLVVLKLKGKGLQYSLAARIAMAAMLVTTGIAHFFYTEGMAMMLPDFVPGKITIVYVTGVIEILAAIGMLIPGCQKITGWLLVLFFILILPANIYAAVKRVNLETATYDGNGLNYLWFRIPLQLFFICWVYFSCIKSTAKDFSGK